MAVNSPDIHSVVAIRWLALFWLAFPRDQPESQLDLQNGLIMHGHTKIVTIDSKGNLVEIEEEVAIDSLPMNVVFDLRRQAGLGENYKSWVRLSVLGLLEMSPMRDAG